MNFSQGAHLIKITMHHVRPHIGITNIRVRDDDGNEILSGELLPNDIFTYNIKIKRDIPFNLFLTISSVEITHALVRTLIETNESNFDDELSIDLNKSTWVVKDTCIQQLQDLGEIQYGTEYKY